MALPGAACPHPHPQGQSTRGWEIKIILSHQYDASRSIFRKRFFSPWRFLVMKGKTVDRIHVFYISQFLFHRARISNPKTLFYGELVGYL
jgi:hypothetical protein